MNNPSTPVFLKILFVVLLLGGCQPVPEKRVYHEVIIQSDQPPAQQAMPAMPVSGELDISSIPDDDIHAFLRKDPTLNPAIPDDDIHASIRAGKNRAAGADMASIPDDDIHAAVRKGQGIPAPMPMTGAMDQETQKMLEASAAKPPLSWTTPQGWKETPGEGMRLASFNSTDPDNPVECTIISLGGQAGGVQSNVARWMKQVNVAVPAGDEFDKFLAGQKKVRTKDNFTATIIDLTQLQSQEDTQSPSMLATIIELPDTTVFVKMTGSRGGVLKNKEKFEALCESLKLN